MYFNSITTGANSEAGIPYPSGAAHVLVVITRSHKLKITVVIRSPKLKMTK
jgi:hypothetical protein